MSVAPPKDKLDAIIERQGWMLKKLDDLAKQQKTASDDLQKKLPKMLLDAIGVALLLLPKPSAPVQPPKPDPKPDPKPTDWTDQQLVDLYRKYDRVEPEPEPNVIAWHRSHGATLASIEADLKAAQSPAPTPAPVVVPPVDAIDLTTADISLGHPNSPDVRQWPIVTHLTSFEIADHEKFERGDTMVEFDGRDNLPPANGSQGAIAYTLWMGCPINGVWHLAPLVECIRGYVPTGPLHDRGQLAKNLLYYAQEPLKSYAPNDGDRIAIFVTTGDTRLQNVQAQGVSVGRSQVVLIPWSVGRWQF